MLVASAAVPAAASIGSSKFRATPEELRRHCWRIDETFWMSKRRYGCGEILCAAGQCRRRHVVYEQPPSSVPIPRKGDGGNGNGGEDSHGRGGDRGNQGSGAAGAAAN
jgi:hypothetical protein